MKLDPPETLSVKFYFSNWSKPSEHIMQVGTDININFFGAIQSQKRGFENAIRHGIVFEFVPGTSSTSIAKQTAPQCRRNKQLSSHPKNLILTGNIAAVQSAPEQTAGSSHQHAGK